MTTIRVARRDRYLVVDQGAVRDARLSLRARGLLVTLLSYPDEFTITTDELAKRVKEGRDAILAAQRELVATGYMLITRAQDAAGRWTTTITVYETPVQEAAGRESPGGTETGFPGLGFPGLGFPGRKRSSTNPKERATEFRDGFKSTCGQCEEGWIFDPDDGPNGAKRRCPCNAPSRARHPR